LTSELYDLTHSFFQQKQFARCVVLPLVLLRIQVFLGVMLCQLLCGRHSVMLFQWVGTTDDSVSVREWEPLGDTVSVSESEPLGDAVSVS